MFGVWTDSSVVIRRSHLCIPVILSIPVIFCSPCVVILNMPKRVKVRTTAIVKYNGILARRRLKKRAKRPARPPTLSGYGNRLPEFEPKMSKQIADLLAFGTPIGSRPVYDKLKDKKGLKFNGLMLHQAVDIAHYLVGITECQRKDLLSYMLMKTKPSHMAKILEAYQQTVYDVNEKVSFNCRTGRPIAIDQLGVCH